LISALAAARNEFTDTAATHYDKNGAQQNEWKASARLAERAVYCMVED